MSSGQVVQRPQDILLIHDADCCTLADCAREWCEVGSRFGVHRASVVEACRRDSCALTVRECCVEKGVM